MAGLEELKKKLQPLLFDDSDSISTRVPVPEDACDSYVVSDNGTVNLLSRSLGEYNINEHGFHKRVAGPDESNSDEKAYRCASHDMHIFGAIGSGASSVVEKAIFIPVHRILALKKINIFEKEKRQQILNEMRTLCKACCYPGLVEFQGAFYMPDSGQISIALEYMDGGSLADVIKVKKSIPEPVLAHMLQKVLLGLRYLHEVRHLVHRDIKPANVLINLKGEAKITDFGISAGLDNTLAMNCSLCLRFADVPDRKFVLPTGTVTYMSPERIRNENYSYAADIWSLGLTVLECATGKFPYDVNEGPANLMLQILDDPSPTPPEDAFSSEFCSFINGCLQKDADARPTCEQLMSHPFLKSFSGNVYVGQNDIFDALSNVRKKLKGDRPREKIVHVVEKLHCRANGETGLAIRVSGSFIVGNQFLVCGEGVKAEGMPNMDELSIDIPNKRVGQFREQFIMEPGNLISCYYISKQDLYIVQV
ncbi:hypothetical protein PR202_ga16912 [Eleusine coracana subsp. coracana]|uniref:mitogen-activated protein kinase kinase n=1 Tax=Eleusine coracana subsp. coracana TaxID=191504 RepID=A0AAV5CNU0_ELECO|nr:hypothetical protein PR202_ga16912 [Eleusine coracana subsp. coracana]